MQILTNPYSETSYCKMDLLDAKIGKNEQVTRKEHYVIEKLV